MTLKIDSINLTKIPSSQGCFELFGPWGNPLRKVAFYNQETLSFEYREDIWLIRFPAV